MYLSGIEVHLKIDQAYSLKEKRKIIRSLLDKTRQRFKLSGAEVDHLDLHNYAAVGFGLVSNSYSHNRSVLEKLLDYIAENYEVEIVDYYWYE